MSMKYIRNYYKVPAKRGGLIVYGGKDGEDISAKITGSKGHYLRAKMQNYDGTYNCRSSIFHPTWNITYL